MLASSRLWRSVSLSLALSLASAVAAAEDAATRQAARKLAEDGVAALQSGDTATALQKLEKAHQMLKVPSVALWSARALSKKGLLVEAAERLREVARLPSSGDAAVQAQARHDAERELAELTPRIPNLVIDVVNAEPSAVTVTLDGAPVPSALLGEDRPVNPGTHRVLGATGDEQVTVDVVLAESERKRTELRFAAKTVAPIASPGAAPAVPAVPAELSSAGPQRTLAYVALGAGAAGLVLGGVTGALALSKKSSLDDDPACAGDLCTYEAEDDVNSLRTLRTVSSIGFIAGGVLAATGVVLLVTAKPSSAQGALSRPSLAVGVGAGHVRLAGSF